MGSKRTLFICELVFLRAENVPIGDLNNLSCDPYIQASLEVPSVHPDRSSTPLCYRTPTIRRTLNPIYNVPWIISGIPDTGFTLTLRLIDEDPGDHDDRLGKTIVCLPDPVAGEVLKEGWNTGEVEYKVEKKKGSIRSHVATYVAGMITRGGISHHSRIWMSVRVISKAYNQQDRRLFTIGPSKYTRHFSPLIGHLISGGTAANDSSPKGKHNKPLGASTFIANRLQLTGPPPRSLRHRYVGYSPFIKSLFKKNGIRGKILNYALHHQFHTIYGYDKSTVYGIAGKGEIDTDGSRSHIPPKNNKERRANGNTKHEVVDAYQTEPDDGVSKLSVKSGKKMSGLEGLTRQFLQMTSYGTAGRIFTYVITLDSEWRFTETGEEFSVDLLSKHSMHADVAKEIAFSGEFFVRRIVLGTGGQEESQDADNPKERGDIEGVRTENFQDYELVIDNDSGTYRPKKELLPTLREWLEWDDNLSALGKVTAMDSFDETLKKWKEERREEKRRAKGLKPRCKKKKNTPTHSPQASDGVVEKMAVPVKGSSLSSINGGELGSRAGSVSSSDVEDIMKEDARRAQDNQDNDEAALDEEGRA
ncbi:hypothetical protein K439DRAFT_1615271 [Ramaria rubella]|nr:hypothetical protein K439DRAFT_1615271 [Ramaria rubella]